MGFESAGGRQLGHWSLVAVASGFAVITVASHLKLLPGPEMLWRLLAAGFEAGTIGALADWFAVRALFQRVPIPLIGRHTNIIVRNRARIADSIARMVQHKWLSREAIAERLAGVSPTSALLRWLETPASATTLGIFASDALRLVVKRIDIRPAAAFLVRAWREHGDWKEVGRPLGQALLRMLDRGDLAPAWHYVADTSERALLEWNPQRRIAEALRRTANAYSSRGITKTIGITIGEVTGALDYDAAAQELWSNIQSILQSVRDDPNDPLRSRIEARVRLFAAELAAGEGDAVAVVEQLATRFLGTDPAEAEVVVQRLLQRLQSGVERQLDEPDSPLRALGSLALRTLVEELRQEGETRLTVDRAVREALLDLLDRHHDSIGQIVRTSLDPARLSDEALVAQIEHNAGDDLQMIRLNGAVLGFALGLVFELFKTALA